MLINACEDEYRLYRANAGARNVIGRARGARTANPGRHPAPEVVVFPDRPSRRTLGCRVRVTS